MVHTYPHARHGTKQVATYGLLSTTQQPNGQAEVGGRGVGESEGHEEPWLCIASPQLASEGYLKTPHRWRRSRPPLWPGTLFEDYS